MYLPIIWIEGISLLQVHFSHFIAQQGTIYKYICFKLGTQFCSACSFSGLIYYGPATCPFRRQIPCANYLFLLFTMKFLFFFFQVNFSKKLYIFFAFWLKKQEAFSERCSLIGGVLRGLVKTCKKYMEVNHFLLLSCSHEK